MLHDPELVAEVRGWLVKAQQDLAAAELELRADPPFLADIVFQAQQAAEEIVQGLSRLAADPVPQDAQP